MKIDHGHGRKLLGRLAVALALGTVATAQHLALPGGAGNLANDIRDGHGPCRAQDPADGGSIRVDLPQAEGGLEITYEVIPLDPSGLGALIPARSEMRNRLRLAGGIAGQMAVIEVELGGASGARAARRTLARGVFGVDGTFEVELPANADLKGTVARGSMLGGRVVTEEVEVELEPAAEEAYISWQVLAKLDRPRGVLHGNPFHRVRHGSVPPRPIR